ncbi:MAG: sporulation protein YqfD [Clostridia bacterium]|nr:sporulation protein YqfD [Clostridia bacterium]
MLFVKLVRIIFGYVRITVSGEHPERFLNLCANNGIAVWNVKRRDEILLCSVFARDYKRIRRLRKRSRVRLKIKRRRGIPFVVHRYRYRKGIVVGALIFVFFLGFMPKFVWSVEVSGNERVSTAEILGVANEIGIKNGAKISSLDIENLRLDFLINMPELSWSAINIEGSRVTIDVRERLSTELVEDKSPCNLVATADGIITKVYVKKGSAAVKVGDAVRKGDVVALGTVEYGDLSTVLCHAMGEIYAETNRKITVTVPLTETKLIPTGRSETKRVFQLFGVYLPLYLGSVKFDYTATADEKSLQSGDTVLPLSIIEAEFREVKKTAVKLSTDEAKNRAKAELKLLETEQLNGAKIKGKKITFTENEDVIVLIADYVCEENIATEKPLSIIE